jgi:hypothetical protein
MICLRMMLFVSSRCIDCASIVSRGEIQVHVVGLKSLTSPDSCGGSDSDCGDVHHIATTSLFFYGQRTGSFEIHVVTRKGLLNTHMFEIVLQYMVVTSGRKCLNFANKTTTDCVGPVAEHLRSYLLRSDHNRGKQGKRLSR